MAILDKYGKPIERDVLREQQTARVGSLHQEFALHPARGLTPARLARILEAAEQGDLKSQAELFDDMEERDGHIFAEMSKRRRALLGLDWDILPPPNSTAQEKRAAELVKEIVQGLDISEIILDMGDAIGKGYSCLEIEWARIGKQMIPVAIEHRPATWFQTYIDNQQELRLRDGTPAGQALWEFGWIKHVHKARPGYVARSGLHRILSWPFLFKVYSVRDLAEFLEIYGLPLRLGTYPRGSTDQEKATLLRAVVNIGHAAAGIIPEGMTIDFKDAAAGASDPFEAMINWCERTQSKAILGATLTSQTDSGSGAYALGNVHNEVRWDLTVSDAAQMARTLTRDLLYPLAVLNVSGIQDLRRAPRFEFDTAEYDDLQKLSESLPPLVNIGVQIPRRWFHERTGIPEPEQDEPVLVPAARAVPFGALKGQAAIAALRGEPTVPLSLVEGLAAIAEDPLRAWLEDVRRMARDATSLEDLRDRLLGAYGDLPDEQLADVLSLAFAAADAAGRADVAEQVDGGV